MFKPILEKSLEGEYHQQRILGAMLFNTGYIYKGVEDPTRQLPVGELGSWVSRGSKDQLLSVNVLMPPPASPRVHKPMVSREAVYKQCSLMPNVLIHLVRVTLGITPSSLY